MPNNNSKSSKVILAIVGMPGAGKTEAREYLSKKGIPFIRFGSFTEDAIKNDGLEITTQNEKIYREKIRNELGMGAYAVLAKPKIDEVLKNNSLIVLDGLYSWEEYTYLRDFFPFLKLISVYAEPQVRYERLSKRKIRPVLIEDGYKRDVAELENLNKGGPIAIADFTIINNGNDITKLYKNVDKIFERLRIEI